MGKVRAVIFDIDGTLLDSNEAHVRAWSEGLAAHGYQVPWERIRPLVGMGGDKLLPELVGVEADSLQGKRIGKRRQAIFVTRYLPHLRPTRGARALVERIRQDGLRVLVASSAKGSELRPLLEAAKVADLIETATSSDDAERSKPDPDIVQATLHEGGIVATQAVMIGDTPYDIEAAHHAGVRIIALRCGGRSDTALRDANAIYDDPADLLNRYDSSLLTLAK